MELSRYTEALCQVGLTHKDVAQQVGISRQALYHRIKTDTLTIADVRIMVRMIRKPITWFFGREY